MKKNSIKGKKTGGELVLDIFKVFFVLLVSIVCVYPFWNIFIISINDGQDALRGGLYFWPRVFTLENYQEILRRSEFVRAIGVTVLRTLIGTPLVVLVTSMLAYVLSRSELLGKKFWTLMFIFTMYFSGGMVPYYLQLKNLGMLDHFIVYIIPGMLNVYYMILIRSYIYGIPESLVESAKLDGANDVTILFRIMVPLSKASIATIALWSIVYHWNEWFNCMLYMKDEDKYVLQYVLRKILLDGQTQDINMATNVVVNTETMKMATLVVSILPIIMLYPFLQKYFAKGVMVGSVKG